MPCNRPWGAATTALCAAESHGFGFRLLHLPGRQLQRWCPPTAAKLRRALPVERPVLDDRCGRGRKRAERIADDTNPGNADPATRPQTHPSSVRPSAAVTSER